MQGLSNKQAVGQFVTSFWIETERTPTRREIMAETGLSEATVKRHLRTLRAEGNPADVGGHTISNIRFPCRQAVR
ncbi:ArsR family transcriptional regulator [Corynebacterium diphtheriae]|uniref:ArsR family transcriptional regulator n=1 Tax=Corynebacterium diphtheriae TaxID=1717 RepID=UPI002ED966FE